MCCDMLFFLLPIQTGCGLRCKYAQKLGSMEKFGRESRKLFLTKLPAHLL
jgi:hypothetical protein